MTGPKLLKEVALSLCVEAETVIACTTLAGLELDASVLELPATTFTH